MNRAIIVLCALAGGACLRLLLAGGDDGRDRPDQSDHTVVSPGERETSSTVASAAVPTGPPPSPLDVFQAPNIGARLTAIARFLPSADSAAIEELMHLAAEDRFVVYTHELRIIIARWVEVDPGKALAFAQLSARDRMFGKISGYLIGMFWNEWARYDPGAALAAAEADSAGALRSVLDTIRESHSERMPDLLANLSPELRIRHGIALPPPGARGTGRELAEQVLHEERWSYNPRRNVESAAESWARNEPLAALQWALQVDAPRLRSYAASGAIKGAIEQDPEAVARLLGNSRNGRYMNAVGSHWAKFDPEAAAAWARGMAPGLARDNFLSGLNHVLGGSDPQFLINLLDGLGWWTDADSPLQQALPEIAKDNPREAMRHVVRIHDDKLRTETAAGIMTTWIEADRAGALRWIEAITSSPGAAAMAGGLGAAIGASNPAAIPPMPEMPSEARQAYAKTFARAMIDNNPAGLADWIGTLEPLDRRAAVLHNVDAFRGEAPAECAAAYAHLRPQDQNAVQISEIGPRFADRDPVAAATWLSSLPNPRGNSLAFGLVATRYGRHDPEAALAWANAIPDEKARGSALRGVEQGARLRR